MADKERPRCDCHGVPQYTNRLGRYRCAVKHREDSRRRNATPRGRAYWAWWNARNRCTNPADARWNDYGGRGVTMCAEWLNDFEAFYAHIGKPPKGRSLDRIDNDAGYEPGNVRWATRKQQAANRRPRKAAA